MVQELVEPLDTQEQLELAECEQIIEKGQGWFIEVGQALLKVKVGIGQGPLYREKYSNFDEYLKERWGFKRSYADELVANAKAIAALSNARHAGYPRTYRTTRPLTTLRNDEGEIDPELVQQAWAKAQEIAAEQEQPHEAGPTWNRQVVSNPRPHGPTEADVRKAVKLVKGEEESKSESIGGKPKRTEAELHFDAAMEELNWLIFHQEWDLIERVRTFIGRELTKRAS